MMSRNVFSEHDKRFDQQDHKIDQQSADILEVKETLSNQQKALDDVKNHLSGHDKRFDQQGSDISEMKETLKLILSRLPR